MSALKPEGHCEACRTTVRGSTYFDIMRSMTDDPELLAAVARAEAAVIGRGPDGSDVTKTTAVCGHWRCHVHRVLSVLDTGGVVFLTNRWPIPCRKVAATEGGMESEG